MPKPRGANAALYQATQAALIEAATALFAARGFDATGTPEVAAAAGVAQGSLFYHFKTKRDLFEAVHAKVQQALIARIEAAAAAAHSPEERFRKVWQGYLTAAAEPAVRRILLLDGPRVIGPERLRAQDRVTALAYFRAELEALAAGGRLRAADTGSLALLLFGALDQAAFEIADHPDDQERQVALIRCFDELMTRLGPA